MKIIDIQNNQHLQEFVATKQHVKYLFFWGHKEKLNQVSKSCFSQWYNAGFSVNGIHYATAEHYMMAEKARLFSDNTAEQKIIAATTPGEAKKLGRSVYNFNEALWNQKRFDIVVQGNLEKFRQNHRIRDFLLKTGERILVEASPVDKIWGIGLASDSSDVENPFKWKGLNLLGYALMVVRKKLSTSSSIKSI
ncbi:NADAR family protein [Agarilytica rhodophyticola]|uniref:NADAR family protein n=1 Tax=Agarilytica rhodophyticola TaxID=1737490 RepID=UPI000B3444F1|nr:NADAR family protein [Agarilytica rhodophyticola]